MSAIIKQTKRRYKIALSIELFIFFVVFFITFILQENSAISFLFGTLAAFVPYCLFVFIVFFVNYKKGNNSQLMAFYKGGFVKFVCTIVFIACSFYFFKSMNYVIFFIGYFSGLLFNNLLPLMVNKYFRI